MKIDRFNYEEFFLLYVDNELTPAERRMVEQFVQENPDLEEELSMLKQSQLKPDATVVLEDKSVLFKSEKNQSINLQNYETFFLLYVDEELTAEERREVESFAGKHPALQEELGILMKTKLTADTTVVFPNKQVLYREAVAGKVVAFRMWRVVAVAVMLLIAVGIFWLMSRNDQPGLADTDGGKTNSKQDEQLVKKSNEMKSAQPESNLVAEAGNETKKEEQATIPQENKSIRDIDQPNKRQLAAVKKQKSDEDELPVDDNIRTPSATLIASVDNTLTPEVKGGAEFTDDKLIVDQAYGQAEQKRDVVLTGEDTPSDEIAVGPVHTKNKLRGIFRQVSRVVEKNTNIPENKKLRIGNIQIALK